MHPSPRADTSNSRSVRRFMRVPAFPCRHRSSCRRARGCAPSRARQGHCRGCPSSRARTLLARGLTGLHELRVPAEFRVAYLPTEHDLGVVVEIFSDDRAAQHLRRFRFHIGSIHQSAAAPYDAKRPACRDSRSGSDGTRTRDLRRDRPREGVDGQRRARTRDDEFRMDKGIAAMRAAWVRGPVSLGIPTTWRQPGVSDAAIDNA
jgi:hypothetical protein